MQTMNRQQHPAIGCSTDSGSDPIDSTAGDGNSVFKIFEAVARRHENKVAVEYGDRALRYGDIYTAAKEIAARLGAVAGVSAKARVALLFDDRVHALGAILGTFAAGHAYVPLDAGDPEERIRLVLKDSEPLALLTDSENLERARGLVPPGCTLVNIEEPWSGGYQGKPAEVDPDDVAYIFYTSGSTGQPKGVCQTHRNLLYFVRCYCRTLGIGEGDRLSLLYSLSFSAANMDVYGGLLNGATVCAYDMRRHGIPGLADWLEKRQISVLHAVPTVFRKLATELEPGRKLDRVRAIDLGGEAVTGHDVDLFRDHFRADCVLVNHLAATEASVIAQHIVEPGRAYGADMLPVGLSPEGVLVRIERPDGGAASPEEVGRIVVASPYVSPGYWRRPELNATAFGEDPGRPGWRILRTEDLGRIGSDGQLHFLGREGTRVKIRGQSVDLVEVEAAIRRCTGVRDVAVVAANRKAAPEADLLIAYVVAANPADKDVARLRGELAAYLPLYMIPTLYRFRDFLPMTASGKIDRRALARQPTPEAQGEAGGAGPLDATEQAIAEVFSRILKRGSVGRRDDFFLLGGDSLLSVELQLSLSELAGRNVPFELLLKDATVAGLAAALRRLEPAGPRSSRFDSVLVPLRAQGSWPPLFLVHGQSGQPFVSPRFIEILGQDQPLFAIQARGIDGVDPPNATIAEMAADYLAAIRSVQPVGPYLIGGLCIGGYVAMEMARVLRAEGQDVLPLLLIDPPAPPFPKFDQTPEVRAPELMSIIEFAWRRTQVDIDPGDSERRKAALEIALAFDRALAALQLKPYGGDVYLMLANDRSGPKKWGDMEKRRAVFSGRGRIVTCAAKHSDVLDVRNAVFAHYLAEYLRQVRELIARPPDSGSVQG
jgi:amino acid adenylation domain-containing protein